MKVDVSQISVFGVMDENDDLEDASDYFLDWIDNQIDESTGHIPDERKESQEYGWVMDMLSQLSRLLKCSFVE